MKLTKWILVLVLLCSFTTLGFTEHYLKGNLRLGKPTTFDTDTFIDINNLKMWVTNTGSFAWDVGTGEPGLIFPKGTPNTVVFASGLWIGAKVGNDIRIALSEYSDEYVPGVMKDSTFSPDEPRFRVYKINKGDGPGDEDWDAWPIQDGAPFDMVDGDMVPKVFGDQTLWAVYNDADPSAHSNNAGATAPLGVEVQITAFAYNRSGALGNTIFLKLKVINKGPNILDSTYVALWSDPDLGGAMDDLVGCDTILSVGYCYNATNNDDLYGATPPCVGYDFFQGPIVPGEPTDTAWVSGEPRPGYKNLPMTAFNKYINGTDPTSRIDTWNYMKGLDAVVGKGKPYVNPVTEDTTTYAMSGDPVTGEGWVDANPADRRFMMCSGPFLMEPGDTQEVVAAIVVAQGTDRLSSISAMKAFDVQAQNVFDANFVIPEPPPKPTVHYRAYSKGIDLIWGQEPVGDTLSYPAYDRVYVFEGYNVYQGASSSGPWMKIATFDRRNTVDKIYIDQPVSPTETERILLQDGSNEGLANHLYITQDYIRGGNLINGREYYFAVTAYSYDTVNVEAFVTQDGSFAGWLAYSEENSLEPVSVVTLSSAAVLIDTAAHSQGTSDGMVTIEYLIQDDITGHDYKVTFNEDDTWNLIDVTLNQTVLASQTNQEDNYAYEVADGIMVRAMGPPLGVKSVAEVQNAAGPVDPPDNLNYSLNSTKDWYMDPGGDQSLNRYSWSGATTHDYEIRFVAEATEYCWDWFGAGDYSYVAPFQVPIEIWDIGIGTVDDPSDDVRITFMIIDDDGSNSFSWGDGLYLRDFPYDDVAWTTPDLSSDTYVDDFSDLHYGRFWFYDYSGELTRPDPGTVVRVLTNKINTPADVFTFKTYKPGDKEGTVIANTLDEVRVVPNPYFNYSDYEPDQFNRVLKFVNLPPANCTIRIFNLAGDLIRVIRKDDPTSSILEWDLRTKHGIPVASGIYIYYLEAEGLGSTYGKMAIFTEKERLLTY